jgi:hypothetical protein
MCARWCMCAVAAMAALALASAARESVVLDHILTVNYSRLNLKNALLAQPPPRMCRTSMTQYRLKMPSDDHPDVYRLPHSRIFEDGVRCGDKAESYPEARLWIEPHMLLVPYEQLRSNVTAQEAGITAMHMAFKEVFRALLRASAQQLDEQVADGDLWVGYEDQARVCGGQTILHSGTFILFALARESRGIEVVFNMVDPPTKRPESVVFTYGSGDDIHMSMHEVPEQKPESFDQLCPSQNDNYDAERAAGSSQAKENGHAAACFPADATVSRPDGSSVLMSALTVGDRVLDVGGLHTDVFLFTHRDDSDRLHPFVELRTADGGALTLSPGHYLYTPGGLLAAQDVRVGSHVVRADGSHARVTARRSVSKRGLYNPQSVSGSLVVDGFAVSTFTTAVLPSYAHALLAPLRTVYRASAPDSFARRGLQRLFTNGAGELSRLVQATLGSSARVPDLGCSSSDGGAGGGPSVLFAAGDLSA